MVSRQPRLESGIADLTVAHDKQGGQTSHVHDTVERIMRDETMFRDLILSIFGGFLESYRMHIRLEEDNFFTEALRLLDDGDWEEVARNFVQRANPLHDSTEQRFATLRHGILRVSPETGEA
jgi:hemerythrin-like domain-containing protein